MQKRQWNQERHSQPMGTSGYQDTSITWKLHTIWKPNKLGNPQERKSLQEPTKTKRQGNLQNGWKQRQPRKPKKQQNTMTLKQRMRSYKSQNTSKPRQRTKLRNLYKFVASASSMKTECMPVTQSINALVLLRMFVHDAMMQNNAEFA